MRSRSILTSLSLAAFIAGASAVPAAADPTPLAHVEVRGSGPQTLILVPGWTCDWTIWVDFMDRNSERFTMHAVTLPGFGGSAPPPSVESSKGLPWMHNAVDAIAQHITNAKLENPVVVGHSLGGVVALMLGVEHPDAAGKIVTIDGFPALPVAEQPVSLADREQMVDERVEPQFKAMTDAEWPLMLQTIIQSWVGDSDRVAQLTKMASTTPRPVAGQYIAELFRVDLTPRLNELKVPTLVISAIGPASVSRPQMEQVWSGQMAAAPNATIVFFDNTYHFIMESRPAELDRAIAQFVNGEKVEGYTLPTPPPAPPAAPATPAPTEQSAPAPGGGSGEAPKP